MTDRVLLSAKASNLGECIALAAEHQLGIEITAFASPTILDGEWKNLVTDYKTELRSINGCIHLHGPFYDLSPGSADPRINQITLDRYRQALVIAADLQATTVIYHANFISALRTQEYRRGWLERNLTFWRTLSEEAAQLGICITIENMWEFDPDIIGDILREIDQPNLRACLDVGHAHLFSIIPFEVWLARLGPYITHLHLNNNPGNLLDQHQSLVQGVLDYSAILPHLRALPAKPTMTLEMDTVDDMRDSLKILSV